MSQAIVDPGELRKFAKDLTRFNRELEALVGGVHGRMRNLENTWRDQEQRKFSDAFNDTVRMLARF
ncbi:MAG: WXG100 family type VII secretion target, partial [Planctomycetota bacterium]